MATHKTILRALAGRDAIRTANLDDAPSRALFARISRNPGTGRRFFVAVLQQRAWRQRSPCSQFAAMALMQLLCLPTFC